MEEKIVALDYKLKGILAPFQELLSLQVDDKEFIEIKSDTPNFPLDGYVIVLFNGSTSGGNTSYFTIDLDGYTTDVNGLLLIGSATVSPFPQYRLEQDHTRRC